MAEGPAPTAQALLDAVERLRAALLRERAYSRQRVGPVNARGYTDAALGEVRRMIAAAAPVEVEAPADRRDEPVTLGRLDEILQDSWLRAADEGSVAERPLAYLRDTVRRGIR